MDPDAARDVSREPHGGIDDADHIDFSANTNPRTPAGVEAVYQAALETARSYPPEPPLAYREAAAANLDCRPEAVVPTPGGLAAIRLAVETTVKAGDTVLVPYPSFGEYAREVRLQGAKPDFVPHDELLAAEPDGHALAIVCNPNNPTGDAYDDSKLRMFASRCRRVGTPLLVDEAFLEYTTRPSLAGTDGVIVARSLTKLFGLPGLRMGYAVATDDHRKSMAAARRTWNMGTPALEVGAFCLRQDAFVRETRKQVRTERERMRRALLRQFDVHPSDAPFLLFEVGDIDVDELVATARRHGIVLRDATTFTGLDSHIRVAVRRSEENDRLLEVLEDV